jgi:hypothetical protein
MLAAWTGDDGSTHVMTTNGLVVVDVDGALVSASPLTTPPFPTGPMFAAYRPTDDSHGAGIFCGRDGNASIVTIRCADLTCMPDEQRVVGPCAFHSFVHDTWGTQMLSIASDGVGPTIRMVEPGRPDRDLIPLDVYGLAAARRSGGGLAIAAMTYSDTLFLTLTDGDDVRLLDLGRHRNVSAPSSIGVAAGLNADGDAEEVRIYFGVEDAVREVAVDTTTERATTTDLTLCE